MELLRANEVAKMLNCSVSQVYAMKDAKKIPFCKIAGMVRFRVVDVEELIQACVVIQDHPSRSVTKLSQPKLKHLRLPNPHKGQ
jgi:excisionase family DNA binding protein